MKLAFLAASLGLLARPLAAEVEIQRSGDRLDLTAVSAPLSEILDRLAGQTGMRVVYDAQPPRQLVTARLDQRTAAEAVVAIMEGLGLNYALVMNGAGTRVDQLLVLGPVGIAPPSTATGRPTPASPRRPQPPELNFDEEPEDPPEDEFEEEDLTGAPEEPAEGAAAPAGPPAPPPPDYPSSSFTPKLPTPAAPSPSAQPSGAGVPIPRPTPTPNPR